MNGKSVDHGLGSSLYKTLKLTWKLAVLGVKKLQNLNESGKKRRALLFIFPYLQMSKWAGEIPRKKKRWCLVLWEQVSLITPPPLWKRDPLVEINIYQFWQKQNEVSGNIGGKNLEVRPVNDTWVVASVAENALEERKKIFKGA